MKKFEILPGNKTASWEAFLFLCLIAEYQDEPELQADMKIEDIYLMAAHRELRSHKFYSALADMHIAGSARGMLHKMATEELKHKEKMEYLYTNTAFPQTAGG